MSMDAEDDVSSVVAEAVSAGKTGVPFLGLFVAQDAPGARVSIDERNAPTSATFLSRPPVQSGILIRR